MNYNAHKLNSQNHSHIIGRQDSVTGDTIRENDEVVFCSACQSVFLVESWEYMDSKHCNQTETLGFVPTPIPTLVAKKKVRGKNNNDKLIFEIDKKNLDNFIKLTPIWFISSFIGIGINSSHWFIYFFMAICLGVLLSLFTDKALQKKKTRKFLKLDSKTVRLFETGIELQNDKFYSYFEIEKIEYIKKLKLSIGVITTYFVAYTFPSHLIIHLKNGEVITQKLPPKRYEQNKPFLFALAWAAQFTELHFYTENKKELGIVKSIERNYTGKILVLS